MTAPCKLQLVEQPSHSCLHAQDTGGGGGGGGGGIGIVAVVGNSQAKYVTQVARASMSLN